ncbi:lysophospholipid acyltransferase family protein [Fulvivirga lutimaris]|uniref:LpxL/LpxP family acyltransferase n=1 Tax=Fulvivirga lutimaris TaxID=1819566 RepID=UPI0012BBD310
MRLVYYLVLLPLSRLPYFILYFLSDVMYVVLYKVLSYRQKVVRTNLVNSFPEKSKAEIKAIETKFYRHFCDLIVESIKAFSITKEEVNKCISFKNPEVMNKFADQGKDVVLVGGHYNNWEIFAVAIDEPISFQPIALFTPLTNAFMNEKITSSRSKYGLWMKRYPEVKEIFTTQKDLRKTVIFGTDQCPKRHQRPHWMEFLNQETGVQFGSEKFAKDNDLPVIYAVIQKVKRGVYEIEAQVVCENPRELPHGKITEMHTKMLEDDIKADPAYWLWTHKRWKRKKSDFINQEEETITTDGN